MDRGCDKESLHQLTAENDEDNNDNAPPSFEVQDTPGFDEVGFSYVCACFITLVVLLIWNILLQMVKKVFIAIGDDCECED